MREQLTGFIWIDTRVVEDAAHELVGLLSKVLHSDGVRDFRLRPNDLYARKVFLGERFKERGRDITCHVLSGSRYSLALNDQFFWDLMDL